MFHIPMTHVRRTAAALVVLASALFAPSAHAEDIDLFVANSQQDSGAAPNLMILLDNSSNWSRSAQHWPGGDQGAAELQSLRTLLASPINANIGLGLYTKVGNDMGGYVRFGIRDMSGSDAGTANRLALSNILGLIQGNINAPIEKVNDSTGEAAALYEMYKYYKSLHPFRGGYSSSNTPNADEKNNNGSSAGRTAHSQGLRTGYAFKDDGDYQGPSPTGTCGSNYVIFIVNNAEGSIPTGSQTFEGVSAGEPLSLLAGVSGISWTDEWANFLYNNGITVYILDAYHDQQNVSHSTVLRRAANVGGGKYFPVRNQEDINLAIAEILAEIRATNSTFAAASLPISATNRSQSLNQVFIGMFRPDNNPRPRWMGNLKQFQLARTTTGIDLVDRLGSDAVSLQTGFVRDCAASLWTTDSGSYWATVRDRDMARSNCPTFPALAGVTGSTWSDFPDGPTVEKGGAAEVLRKGNNPPTTNATPTWVPVRTILTYSSESSSKLTALTTSHTGWSSTLDSWVKGLDDTAATFTEFTDTVQATTTTTATSPRSRPSIHGDVIHSRPLPVNYGAGGVTVYYGANDGMLRAVDAATGKERWAYVAPEHYSAYPRLHDNTPLVSYPNVTSTLNPQPKDYFFDGSFGIYQNIDSSKVWIFPSMRRGGRMLYGFDVTNPASPRIKWRIGCPNLIDDTGCTSSDVEGIGQTWSMPNPAFLKGYSEYSESSRIPILVVGGGYDRCEDVDSATTSCPSSRKGNWVYVINADTGVVIRKFSDSAAGSFAADITLSDTNGDGSVDFAYAADTKGNIYRIDFSNVSDALTPLREDGWRMRRVAYTSGGGRKFLYPPSLLGVGTNMYVALGSGNRERPLQANYPYQSNVKDRFYVFLDDLTITASSTTATAVNLDAEPVMNVTTSTTCDGDGVAPGSTWKGWYMDLPGRGEQVVTSALIAAGMVAFNTNRPVPPTSSVNSCAAPLGEARGYWVSLVNASGAIGSGNNSCGGDRSSAFVGGGLTPSPTLARVVIDGRTTTVAIGAANRQRGPSVTIDPQEVKPTIDSRRKTIYWKSNAAD
jgi:type IV pilus assembly protein PilY1